MGKSPGFFFYVKDWMTDPALKAISYEHKGIWIDMLCYMDQAQPRGKLRGEKTDLAKLFGITLHDFEMVLNAIKKHKVGNVTNRHDYVTISCRRMLREEKAKETIGLKRKRSQTRNYYYESINDIVNKFSKLSIRRVSEITYSSFFFIIHSVIHSKK